METNSEYFELFNLIRNRYSLSLESWHLAFELFKLRCSDIVENDRLEKNISIINEYSWILWDTSLKIYFNYSVVQTLSIIKNPDPRRNWKKDDEFLLYKLLLKLKSDPNFNLNEVLVIERKLCDFVYQNESFLKDLKNSRDNTSHLFDKKKQEKTKTSIKYVEYDKVILALWQLLYELEILIFNSQTMYSQISDYISEDYCRLFSELSE